MKKIKKSFSPKRKKTNKTKHKCSKTKNKKKKNGKSSQNQTTSCLNQSNPVRVITQPAHATHATQDSRAVEFPLELKLELQSCAVSYLNQTWLEAFDYAMNGVLGDGPWCPWRLLPKKAKVRD